MDWTNTEGVLGGPIPGDSVQNSDYSNSNSNSESINSDSDSARIKTPDHHQCLVYEVVDLTQLHSSNSDISDFNGDLESTANPPNVEGQGQYEGQGQINRILRPSSKEKHFVNITAGRIICIAGDSTKDRTEALIKKCRSVKKRAPAFLYLKYFPKLAQRNQNNGAFRRAFAGPAKQPNIDTVSLLELPNEFKWSEAIVEINVEEAADHYGIKIGTIGFKPDDYFLVLNCALIHSEQVPTYEEIREFFNKQSDSAEVVRLRPEKRAAERVKEPEPEPEKTDKIQPKYEVHPDKKSIDAKPKPKPMEQKQDKDFSNNDGDTCLKLSIFVILSFLFIFNMILWPFNCCWNTFHHRPKKSEEMVPIITVRPPTPIPTKEGYESIP